MSLRYYFLALIFWLGAALLCFPIEKEFSQASFNLNFDNSLQRIFGGAAEAIGDTLFLKADSYFHGGVVEKFKEEGESLRTESASPEENAKEEVAPDWIADINHRVTSHTHRHLNGEELREILPFFALSTALDPHNVEAILTAAFWLDKSFSKTGEAIQVLEKGVRDNPDSWELESELAHLYLVRKKDAAPSERHYLEAIRKSAGLPVENFKRLDMNYFLAQAYELEGKKSDALAFYREALKFFDVKNPPALKEKILEKIQILSV